MDAKLLDDRSTYSLRRLDQLKRRTESISGLEQCPQLCIYLTGSYGRLEASEKSDLDPFFVQDDTDGRAPVDRLTKILIDADLIRIARELKFPEFSNEGQYLEIHSLTDILDAMGDREDDYKNYFTARMLLLLESRALCNEATYQSVMKRIVDSYFRDYHDHVEDFRPVFLVNDILRFWKTLCLNYEHRRNRPDKDKSAKAKSHLRNLKLKFSRLMTCFSMVIALSCERPIDPDKILELAALRPIDRVRQVAETTGQNQILETILQDYAWFLDFTAQNDIVELMTIKKERSKAFQRGDAFASSMYKLLESSASPGTMRYLTI